MNWKPAIFFIIFVIMSVFSTEVTVKANAHDAAVNGVLKMTDFPKDELIQLKGEWQFFWHELYIPEDFVQKTSDKSPIIVTVPQPWTSYKINGKELPLTGYGTYRLSIHLPKDEIGTVKALYIPNASSAYILWINGEEKSKGGKVGKSREAMKPGHAPRVIPFLADSSQVEIVIQVSNFHQRKAGLVEQILMGEPETVITYKDKSLIYRAVIVISLLIIGLYHIGLFGFHRKERSLLFFAALCIVVAIRATLLEEELAYYLLSFLNWEIACKLEYLGASLGTLFISLFTYTQFSEDMNRKVRNLIIMILLGDSLFIIATPAVIYTRTMIHLQVLIILVFLYILYVYVTVARRKREGSILNAVATFMLFLTALNDILFYNNLIHTMELTSVGLFFFLFTQSIILSKRYSSAFARTERLSKELGDLNASLERQVQRRTMELEQANQELSVANQRLYEAQQSKNKWIRNISHELATPLTNIRSYTKGMIDGVIQADRQYVQLIYDQSLHFSRMLDDLYEIAEIENNQIAFHLERVLIRDYLGNFFEKMKWDMEQHGIIFTYNDVLPPSAIEPVVLMDRTRINQVLVNLVSNAQRFVGESGRIGLELSQREKGHVRITVTDNGSGIKTDELDLVFNRFYKSSHQGKPHHGSGLGLAIAKEIIEYHNGTISVESKWGEGSCFSFSLPLVEKE